MMKHGVTSLTTSRVLAGTRQVVSLHQRNVTKDETGMTEICATSSAVEIHADGSKTDVRRMSASNRSSVKKVTLITMVLIMINLTNSVLPKGWAHCRKSQSLFPRLEEVALAPELQTVGDREV
jgi:hypothetical protein